MPSPSGPAIPISLDDTHRNRAPSPRGFSLVEVICSIAIITVLIALLMPMIPKVRNAARRSACAVNLRSLGQGVEMYKHEFKEMLPLARYMPPPWLSRDDAPPLNVALARFIEPDTTAYRCPGDRVVHATAYTDASGAPRTTGMSYTYLSELGGRPYERTFYFTKFGLSASQTPLAHDFDGGSFETQSGAIVRVDFFHDVRNLLFVDGHVGRFAAPTASTPSPRAPSGSRFVAKGR